MPQDIHCHLVSTKAALAVLDDLQPNAHTLQSGVEVLYKDRSC